MRRFLLVGVSTAIVLVSAGSMSAAAPPTLPTCPPLNGWAGNPERYIDNGVSIEAWCDYNQPNEPYTATLDVHWQLPSTPIAQAGVPGCGKAATSASYYANIYSKSFYAEEEYRIGGTADAAAVFSGNRQVLDEAALAYLHSAEKLALACKSSSGGSTSTTTTTAVVPTPPKPSGRIVGVLHVPVNRASVTSTVSLNPKRAYVLEISGVVGVHQGVIGENDAFYCIPGQQPDRKPGDCTTPQFFAMICTGTARRPIDVYHCVSPDALAGKAGHVPYSPSHIYRLKITGISGRLTLGIRDASLVNNSGGWAFKIYDAGLA